jgi:NADH:ubiquinone reductase (H+-translocating)
MAVVGKNFAILESGRLRMSGFITWLVWVFLHLMSLPQLQNRLRVQSQWLWSYYTGQRSSRLIPESRRTETGKEGPPNCVGYLSFAAGVAGVI